MAGYTKKIAYNTLIQFVGKAITTTISIVTLATIARYLGVSLYGEYATAFAFIGFFSILADMGFYTIAVKEMAARPDEKDYIIGNILLMRIALALAFVVIAPIVGWLIPVYSLAVKQGILIICLSTFFVLINQIFVSVFQYFLRMDKLVLADSISRAVMLVVVLIAVYLKLPLPFFFLAHLLANIALCLLSYLFARKFVTVRLKYDSKYWKYIAKEASTLGLVLVLGFVYFKVDSLMLSLLADSRAVGIYSASYKVLEIMITIPAMFMGSVFPLIVRYIKDKDERLQGSFQKSFDFMSLLALPMLLSLVVLAKPIMLLLAGGEFTDSILVLQYLSFAIFIIFYGTIFGNFVVAANLQKKMIYVYLLGMVFNTITNAYLISRFSYYGAALTTVVTELLVASLTFIIIKRHFGFVPNLRIFFKALTASVVMAALLYVTRGAIHVLLLAPIGLFLYIGVLYVLKAINRDTLKTIFKS
ncbi:MAG: flippase [Patescibacteria group bacterium]